MFKVRAENVQFGSEKVYLLSDFTKYFDKKSVGE